MFDKVVMLLLEGAFRVLGPIAVFMMRFEKKRPPIEPTKDEIDRYSRERAYYEAGPGKEEIASLASAMIEAAKKAPR
ncbi:hypothetical protein [Spirosoma pollinicola]|uniref:Uncharacterized protein n=1 Tax=Spirosoma pollinicola TaxID=2057025 RepID=A0A2K8Z6A7_9BACT|nr:hypothetical protein [Spirosoma pollinicola]AUD05364.1 hypothetical protein CWM47_28025 [Spirosoma pollinicola]